MTAEYVDALPPTLTDKHPGIRWTPGATPGCGRLTIVGKRCRCVYAVAEFPVDAGWDGRAFAFVKGAGQPGTDAEADRYDVFVGRRGSRCDCKGNERWGRCKHVDAARALIENGWLDLSTGQAPTLPLDPPDCPF